ncbi:MAG TPA: ABC transporter permease [Bryobacteraceae bacterium]|nr:ABC transporter permease [Bryobacteraceae bacterium]
MLRTLRNNPGNRTLRDAIRCGPCCADWASRTVRELPQGPDHAPLTGFGLCRALAAQDASAAASTGGTATSWSRCGPCRSPPISSNWRGLRRGWVTLTWPEAEPEDNPNVVVLTYDFWARRLGRDRDIIGRTINLNGRLFTVTGVMPRGYNMVMGGLIPQMFVTIGLVAPDWKSAGLQHFPWSCGWRRA